MTLVGHLVRETILMKRALECDHRWEIVHDGEEKCPRCGVAVTPEGKALLERLARERRERR